MGDLFSELDTLSSRAIGISKMAVYDGAHIMADAIKAATPVGDDGGDLRDSLGIATIKVRASETLTTIGFDGYDRNGVPNNLKARVFEFGRSTDGFKRPFVRPAQNRARAAAQAAMAARIETEIQKTVGGK